MVEVACGGELNCNETIYAIYVSELYHQNKDTRYAMREVLVYIDYWLLRI